MNLLFILNVQANRNNTQRHYGFRFNPPTASPIYRLGSCVTSTAISLWRHLRSAHACRLGILLASSSVLLEKLLQSLSRTPGSPKHGVDWKFPAITLKASPHLLGFKVRMLSVEHSSARSGVGRAPIAS